MKKIVFQNLFITLISKILAFISFLYIAKVLTQSEYGAFVYINMILSLLPLFQFGSMHGAVILLPKYIASDKNKKEELFVSYNSFSIILQAMSVFLLYIIDIKVSQWILLVISINYILSKYVENGQIYLNSHLQFQKANYIKVIDQVLRPIVILAMFYTYKNIESIFIAHFITTFITVISTIRFVKLKFKFSFDKKTLKKIYKIGFFVYLIWGIDILFRTADRLFISQFYDINDLAVYGFTSALAMNIWLLSMSFFSPYSQLLYKAVAESNFTNAKNIVESTNKKLFLLLAVTSVVAVAAYPYLLEFIVHNYFGTYYLFFILVLISIFLSINNMYIYYMISNSRHFILLKYQIVILLSNILLNAIFAYWHFDIVYYGYSTLFALAVYFLLIRRSFYIDIDKKLGPRGFVLENELR